MSTAGGFVLLLGDDLFFSSKISGAVRAHGGNLRIANQLVKAQEMLAKQAFQLMLIDLEAYQDSLDFLSELKTIYPEMPVMAYASHVNVARLQEARQNGADKVMPRSQFSSNIDQLVQSCLVAQP
jgi:DNA-binding NtrC family response regulator